MRPHLRLCSRASLILNRRAWLIKIRLPSDDVDDDDDDDGAFVRVVAAVAAALTARPSGVVLRTLANLQRARARRRASSN